MCALGLFSTLAIAQKILPLRPTVNELAMLPKDCDVRLNGSDEAKRIASTRLGEDTFLALHHYCFGLNYLNRARFTMKRADKKYYLETAIGELNYVLKHFPINSPLRPEAEVVSKQARGMLSALR